MLGTVLNNEDRMMYKVKFSDTVELIKRDDIHRSKNGHSQASVKDNRRTTEGGHRRFLCRAVC